MVPLSISKLSKEQKSPRTRHLMNKCMGKPEILDFLKLHIMKLIEECLIIKIESTFILDLVQDYLFLPFVHILR